MKYIAYKDLADNEYIITFSGDKTQPQHNDVAKALGINTDDIVGAGFFLDIGGRKKFMGESFTLGIESRGEVDRDLYIEQSKR
ncbi:hypothetical protein KAR91_32885 [Candidatus Pacearchaeota archaeon]|nr:hypothetical protein [Candidatus Pacearchaeota archaeon]